VKGEGSEKPYTMYPRIRTATKVPVKLVSAAASSCDTWAMEATSGNLLHPPNEYTKLSYERKRSVSEEVSALDAIVCHQFNTRIHRVEEEFRRKNSALLRKEGKLCTG
jgi:hypothetical protein